MDPKLLQNALLFVIAAGALLNAFGTYRVGMVMADAAVNPQQIVVISPVDVRGNVGIAGPVSVDAPVAAAPAPAPAVANP